MAIKGKIKIVNMIDDYYDVMDKVIIVARNTHPDIVVVMDKVLAIVVEVDNKLCHAAIIAREYGKPLLLGVEGARKRFKDGDKVEVNTVKKTICKI
jgi:phosphoenolpyruvate synthase/pyruvate phosphate dikinase